MFEMVGTVDPVKLEQWNPATGKRLGKGRTEIASFVAVSNAEFDPMQVNPEFTYDVAIEGVSLDIFKEFVRQVFRIVTEAETGSPPHPFAPYPLYAAPFGSEGGHLAASPSKGYFPSR